MRNRRDKVGYVADGTTREVERFLWWPTFLPADHDRWHYRWLERARIEQVFGVVGRHPGGYPRRAWRDVQFINQ